MTAAPLCNRRPETALVFAGRSLPLCIRCSCVFCGYLSWLTVSASLQVTVSIDIYLGVLSAVALVVFAVDGFNSYASHRGTNNFNRAVTGFGFGMVLSAVEMAVGVSPLQFLGF